MTNATHSRFASSSFIAQVIASIVVVTLCAVFVSVNMALLGAMIFSFCLRAVWVREVRPSFKKARFEWQPAHRSVLSTVRL